MPGVYHLSAGWIHQVSPNWRQLQQSKPCRLGQGEHALSTSPAQRLRRRYRVFESSSSTSDESTWSTMIDSITSLYWTTTYSTHLCMYIRMIRYICAYVSGIFQPRVAVNGSQLTSPRLVSSTFIVVPPSVTAANFTLALMSWGQFITHDLTLAAAFTSGTFSPRFLSLLPQMTLWWKNRLKSH